MCKLAGVQVLQTLWPYYINLFSPCGSCNHQNDRWLLLFLQQSCAFSCTQPAEHLLISILRHLLVPVMLKTIQFSNKRCSNHFGALKIKRLIASPKNKPKTVHSSEAFRQSSDSPSWSTRRDWNKFTFSERGGVPFGGAEAVSIARFFLTPLMFLQWHA